MTLDLDAPASFGAERGLRWPAEEDASDEAFCSPDAPAAVWGASLERSGFYAQAADYWAQAAGAALTARQRHWCESRQAWCEQRAGREQDRLQQGERGAVA